MRKSAAVVAAVEVVPEHVFGDRGRVCGPWPVVILIVVVGGKFEL